MSRSELPERASLEFLKKLAKERLRELRRVDPQARLAAAQREVARDHGFPSWRALRAELDRRRQTRIEAFFAACGKGEASAVREFLEQEPALARERHGGSTGLHVSVKHPEVVRLLLAHGADPNSRDDHDNALPLFFAVGEAPIESVRALLDAGSDVHGAGDAHQLEVIGAATVFDAARRNVVELLVERGARHHVFSAIALGDVELLRRVVAADPTALRRRLSRTEQEQTALHYVIAPPEGLVGGRFRTGEHYRTLRVLIELGADLEAKDAKGRTPLELAMLRGDEEAMQSLRAAGAEPPRATAAPVGTIRPLAGSVRGLTPMLAVADVRATVDWYRSVGFELAASHAEEDRIGWACLRLGAAEIMLVPSSDVRRGSTSGISLWFRTDRLDELHASLKGQQLERARALLADRATTLPEVRFSVDLYTAFYGQREFGVRDPNGIELMFYQPLE